MNLIISTIQETEGEDLKGKLDTLKADEKKRLSDIKHKEKMVGELEQRRDNPPEFEDIDGLQAEIVTLPSSFLLGLD